MNFRHSSTSNEDILMAPRYRLSFCNIFQCCIPRMTKSLEGVHF
uniref:Uncharacterized protein n=1 Tax=Lepeophtheirus salmonis TaxID=72036 RepID=A0A0K2VF24_LEPSM